MVHALSEIQRVLTPDGILIDLRPILDHWHVEVASAREVRETGRVQDFPMGLADDEAANRAMATAESNRWFKRESEEFFPLYYSWDSATRSKSGSTTNGKTSSVSATKPNKPPAPHGRWAMEIAESV